jgi:hypothetical protein
MAEIVRTDGGTTAEQDKDAFLDYSFDWTEWLSDSDTIQTSSWSAGAGITLSNSSTVGAVTSIWVQGGTPGTWYAIKNSVISASGRKDDRVLRLYIRSDAEQDSPLGTALFPNKVTAVAKMRADRLVMLASSLLGSDFAPSNDYVWSKIVAAEKDAERRLRVFFEPVTVFAYEPLSSEISALNGARYVEEAAYDYEPGLWGAEDWGYLVLRKNPVIAVESCVLAYPAPTTGFFTVPLAWIRVDKKAGHIRFVPTGSALSAGPLSAFILSAMGGGRNIPQMIQFRYRSGLSNAASDYPDLIDLVQKMACLRIVQDAYLPQSGSISADGLSQSMSVQMDAYHDGVDAAIDALTQSLHGVRMIVL